MVAFRAIRSTLSKGGGRGPPKGEGVSVVLKRLNPSAMFPPAKAVLLALLGSAALPVSAQITSVPQLRVESRAEVRLAVDLETGGTGVRSSSQAELLATLVP